MNSSTGSSARGISFITEYQGKLIALLLVLMFILWLVTIGTTRIIEYPADPFYYVKQLPVSYWAGMALAVIVLLLLLYKPLPKMKSLAEISFILVLILYLSGTPCFIYANPRFLDVYRVVGWVDSISETGGLAGMSSWYLTDWPMANIMFSSTSQVLGLDALSVAKYYPMFSMFLLTLLLYALARKVSPRYYVIAPIAYMSLAWVQEYHMAPQNYALLLSVLLIFLLLSLRDPAFQGNERTKIALIIIVWVVMVLAHGATPLLNLFALFSLFIIYFLMTHLPLTKKAHPWGQRSPRVQAITSFIILFAVVWFFYAFFEAEFVGVRLVNWLQTTIDNIMYGDMFVFEQRNVTTPAASYSLLNSIRWVSIIGTLALGVLISLYIFLKKRSGSLGLIMVGFFIGYMGVSFYLVVGNFASYGADRGFIFGLIPASLLFTMMVYITFNTTRDIFTTGTRTNWSYERLYSSVLSSIVLAFIVVSLLTLPVTKYGSDPYAFVSESEWAGRVYAKEHPEAKAIYDFTYVYNRMELMKQEGEEYRAGFLSNDLNMIYDSGQSRIYLSR